MRIVFCCDPINPRHPDSAYEREAAAADRLGIPVDLVDFEALVAGKLDSVLRRVPALDGESPAVFRGWMLSPALYGQLHAALGGRGRRLINSPDQYQHCHYLPASYDVIEGSTPRSVWMPLQGELQLDKVMELLRPFGDRPIIVKDYVKSRKHEWEEACFIPSAADRSGVERVVRRFLALQGTDLNVGLVFREFVEFEQIGVHPRSGMPLSREFRQFFMGGKPLLGFRYWDEGEYGELAPPQGLFAEVAARVRSSFFTMDVARTKSGEWMIVELGDGQVAGLPEVASPDELFKAFN